MQENTKLNVKGYEIVTFKKNEDDYISLTDIAHFKDKERTNYIIQNWMRNRSTIEFLGLWEIINNPGFKGVDFDAFKNQAGSNSFSLTPQRWVEATNAIGIISKSGRYGGGVYAHKDVAFEFASWISTEFKLYLIKEFQRLKEKESDSLKLEWNIQRTLAKINYKIHTDAIEEKLIPPTLSKDQINSKYADEADLLNVALFGITAKMWRTQNPKLEGNIRDGATLEQLVVLSNLESINAVFIRQGLPQNQRLQQLNQTAIIQIKSLIGDERIKKIR